MTDEHRPDPDVLLARLKREEREQRKSGRGHLRIYLGAFPGVGKTFAMLNEAHRRVGYGEDVVVGFAETHGRRATDEQLQGLEVLPRKRIEYGGVIVEELNVDAVLERRPRVCLVDELAHTNVAGSAREKRYEDVEEILGAGIDVVSTLNVQHLESLNDTIAAITGIRVRETIPDVVLDDADEVILIDLSPEGARARLQHGNVYPPEQARQALENFFRPENLAALRELALRRTTQEVDEQLEEYMRESQYKTDLTERVVVLVDDDPQSRALLRHGWRLAQGMDGELLIAYFRGERSDRQERELARTLELAEDLNGQICPLEGDDRAVALSAFLKAESVHQIVLQRESRKGLTALLRPSLPDRLMALSPDVNIYLPATNK
ncbi:MAG TPA: sensor histidine kinase KdpD [Dehalococcoidia bacterium]|nr:sensor histidine kinase KdpD [Dehalococcoidia bacterium]